MNYGGKTSEEAHPVECSGPKILRKHEPPCHDKALYKSTDTRIDSVAHAFKLASEMAKLPVTVCRLQWATGSAAGCGTPCFLFPVFRP